MRVEHSTNIFRAFLWGILIIDDFLLYHFTGSALAVPHEVAFMIVIGVGFIYSVHKLTSDGKHRQWMKYLTISIDFILFVQLALDYRDLEITKKVLSPDDSGYRRF